MVRIFYFLNNDRKIKKFEGILVFRISTLVHSNIKRCYFLFFEKEREREMIVKLCKLQNNKNFLSKHKSIKQKDLF